MSIHIPSVGVEQDESIPFGLPPGDESHGASTAVDDSALTPADVGSDESQPGMEMMDVGKLLDEMESTRQRLLSDPRITAATVRLGAVAETGYRGAQFQVFVHTAAGCSLGCGQSIADAEIEAMLKASVKLVERKAAAAAERTAARE